MRNPPIRVSTKIIITSRATPFHRRPAETFGMELGGSGGVVPDGAGGSECISPALIETDAPHKNELHSL